jgi:hypothetical protein
MDTNVVRFADREWLEKMADKDWPSLCHFGQAFVCGLLAYVILYGIVWAITQCLKYKGGVSEDHVDPKIRLSELFAWIEQFIFFLAPIAGTQVFGFAVTGWFVLKAVSNYDLWTVRRSGGGLQKVRAGEAALAHNRRLIFLIGTLMSVTAGGLAGFVYHWKLHLLEIG